ncbi:MAG: cbb3-type cytochrome c oxidase subunit 3 [Alphaproteobacteria bacterium]|nr:cbb3-type cytochrome c oxidase subunit 3 [Alphaproteobacteria bacterium]NDC55898.1 cbb3-type cytochrome c oxidase subunit 3 [Alphaproteobacteria bacterium]NDG04266.1 cbb3-type cytochrome c oxidase subunit 3 [Alphaproteobacteria bacterium]
MTWFIDHAPQIGLIFFFVVFLLVAVWAYWPANKQKLEQHASIPLKDGQHE